MNYTKSDKVIIIAGIVAIVLFGLFPPWAHYHPQTGYLIETCGTSIFFEPPDEIARINFSQMIYNLTMIAIIFAAILVIKKLIFNRSVM